MDQTLANQTLVHETGIERLPRTLVQR